MGAWGTGTFDSDTALDFLDGLDREHNIPATLVATLAGAGDTYTDVYQGDEAWAAIGLVCAAADVDSPHVAKGVWQAYYQQLLPADQARALLPAAAQACTRLTSCTPWLSMWLDGPGHAAERVADLRHTLDNAMAPGDG